MHIVVNLAHIPIWVYGVILGIIYAKIGRMISSYYAKKQMAQALLYKAGGCGKPCCDRGICGENDHTCKWLGDDNLHQLLRNYAGCAKIFSILIWPVILTLHLVIALFLSPINASWQKAQDSAYAEHERKKKAERVAKADQGQREFAERERARSQEREAS